MTAAASRARPRPRSGASSCSPRRRTPPRRSAGGKFYEMARKGETVPVDAEEGPRLGARLRTASRTAGSPSRSPAPRAPTSARSRATSARSSAAARTSSRCAARASATFDVADAVTLERFEAMPPAERLAPPHAVPLSRVPFPFPRIQLASLEAWKIRRGQAVPARGLEAREGRLGHPARPLERHAGARPGQPDRGPGRGADPAPNRAADWR